MNTEAIVTKIEQCKHLINSATIKVNENNSKGYSCIDEYKILSDLYARLFQLEELREKQK